MTGPDVPFELDPAAFGEPLPATREAFEAALGRLPDPQEATFHTSGFVELIGDDDTKIKVTVDDDHFQRADLVENGVASSISLLFIDSDGLPHATSSVSDTSLGREGTKEVLDNQHEVVSTVLEALTDLSNPAAAWIREACNAIGEEELFRNLIAEQLIATCPGQLQTWHTQVGRYSFWNGTALETYFTIPEGEPLVGQGSTRRPSRIQLREQDGRRYDYGKREDGKEELAIVTAESPILAPPQPPDGADMSTVLKYIQSFRTARHELVQASRQGVFNLSDGSLRQLNGALETALDSGVMSLS